jgi:hypothetical protein
VSGHRAEGPEPERRRAPRYTPEELVEPVSVVGSRLVNISIGGLMVEAPVPIAPDSTLRVHLVVSGEKSEVDTRVRACVARPQGLRRAWGLGLEFESIAPAAQERLAHALAPRRVGQA